jgi:site-specific DNA recombinase
MKLHDLEMSQRLKIKNTPEKRFYLVYCRKSEESEDKQIQSLEDQLSTARNLASTKNLHLLNVEPFVESRSAKKPGRPQFNGMLDLIEQRNDIRGIIVWKPNRLFRNPVDEGKIRWLLQSGEIDEIVTPDKTYTQVDSDFLMAIEGAQAQRYVNDLRKDVARGIQSKISKGMAPICAPTGYRNTREKRQGERTIEVDPVNFPLMRQIFDLFLTGNYSVDGLHSKAEELGLRNKLGKPVLRSQFHKILKNPFYTGTRFIYAGKLYTNGIHKRMITDEEFDLVQDILAKKSRPRFQIHKGFLNGTVRCGECNSMITAEVHKRKYKNGKSQLFAYYRCTKKKQGYKCSQPYIPVQTLDTQASDYLRSIMLSTRFVEWGIKWLKIMHSNQQEVKEAKLKATQTAYNAVDRKIANLVDLMLDDIISKEDGVKKKAELEAQKTKLNETLSSIDSHANEWTNLTIDTFNFVKTAQDKFLNGTIEEKKTILRVIGSNLVLKDKNLEIELRKPFQYIQEVVKELEGKRGQFEAKLPALSSKEAFIPSDAGSSESILC